MSHDRAAPVVTMHEGIHVVRDDLYPGGTKARFLPVLFDGGVEEVVYASPAQGGAQVAQRAALGLGPAAHGIAGRLGGKQRLQRGQQPRILCLSRRPPTSRRTDTPGRALCQPGREFPPAAPNGPSVQAGDLRQQRIPAAAKALGFECHEPAALLLIQASDQQIDVLVNDTIRMRLTIPASRTSTWTNNQRGHRQPSPPPPTLQASRPQPTF